MQVVLPIDKAFDGEVIYHRANQLPLVNAQTHSHSELEMNLIMRGKGTYVVQGRRYAVGVHSCLWLFADQEHMLIEQSHDFEMWICLFREQVLEEHRPHLNNAILNADKHDGIFQRLLGGEDAQLIDSLCRRITIDDDSYRFNQGIHWLLLETWRLFQESELLVDLPHLPACVEQAVLLLQRDDYELPVLARKVGVSDSWLSRSMHKHVGMTFSDFRNRQRIERFFKLYGNGKRENMTSCAYAAGFNSYAQFYKVMKHICGRTPRQISREIKEKS